MRITQSILALALFQTFALGTRASLAEPAKPAGAKPNTQASGTASQPPQFVKLSELADKQIHDQQLVKASATAAQILKMATAEKEAETQCRELAEVHKIRAEIAILSKQWDVAEKELEVVKKVSVTFAGNDDSGHFDDLLTLIRQKAGKCQAGPKDAVDMDKEFAIKKEMRTLQTAVEDYAREHERKYPASLAELAHGYMGKFNNRFMNPYTKKEETPELAANTTIPQDANLAKGRVFYKCFENGDNYVIYAGGHDGKPLVTENGDPFVLRSENAPKELPFDPTGKHPHID